MGKQVYNRIKSVLAEKNVTSRDLAKRLKKTETSVSRWCTNDMQPSIEVLFAIAKYLDVDVRELLVKTK
jgi:putative transcriptional regulator